MEKQFGSEYIPPSEDPHNPEYYQVVAHPNDTPELVKKFERPDGTQVEYAFRRNRAGNFVVTSKESDGSGQHVSSDLDEEGMEIFLTGLKRGERMKEIE